jgi:glycine cleavage system H protein
MNGLLYTKDHEYVRMDGDVAIIGITDYAQKQLGDIVFIELPPAGKHIDKGAELAVVESVKAASEVYAPVSGDVVEVNDELEDTPAVINEDAQGKGWFVKLRISDTAQLAGLLDEAAYQTFLMEL